MKVDPEFRHKWWGWGAAGTDYDMTGRPAFWKWITSTLDYNGDIPNTPRLAREAIVLPAKRFAFAFESELQQLLKADQVRSDDDDRLLHSFGRSYRDLLRLREGLVDRSPDIVVYPESEEEVERLIACAVEHDVCIVPFGGGTNIVGCVEPNDDRDRFVVCLDLRRLNRLRTIDEDSCVAEIEAGAFGPQIETALNERGYSLGHFPDSFQYSTLGGWLATRSAGTQSNAYGKIEDMLVSLKVATPTGRLVTKTTPAASTGPDLNRFVVGSEGTLGVITSARMRVHPVPEFEEQRLVLFPSFESGYEALLECVRQEAMPSLARLSDEWETELIFAAKPAPKNGKKSWLETAVKWWLKQNGYRNPAVLVVGFEGKSNAARPLSTRARAILRRHGGFDLGTKAGAKWKESRFDIPYLRDYLMDFGIICDSMETATVWSNVIPLYRHVKSALEQTFRDVGRRPGYVGCHISHLYPTGACLYFTVGAGTTVSATAQDRLAYYAALKHAATQAIVEAGGALSHHHAVGREHQPWLADEISAAGARAIASVKTVLDPSNIMNPGALAGSLETLEKSPC